eukprot:scaffold313845_cov28-Prasinocladus_malaysianus.AAC.1
MESPEDQQWLTSFKDGLSDLLALLGTGSASPQDAAALLRRLVQQRRLGLVDVRDHPERFFAAHHALSGFATRLGPGFGIRFTVQFNLFAGTVVALGGKGCVCLLARFIMHANDRTV